MKIMGAVLVLWGSTWIAVSDVRRRRRTLKLLRELASALLDMEAAIRWKQRTLPRAIGEQTNRSLCGVYFLSVLDALQKGNTLQQSWMTGFSTLQPSAAAECLCQVELSGDETHLRGNLHLAAENLQQLYQQKQREQRQEEKVHLSLLFSGAGMLIILLL